MTDSRTGEIMIIFKQKEKELYSAAFDILKGADTIGGAFFYGNMASVFGDWDINVCGKHISLQRVSKAKARFMAASLTSDEPLGQMEIFIDGVAKGIVFQGFHKKSLFKDYSVHHIIYDRQQIYHMYPIGFGEEGSKNPVYVEEYGVEKQVALTEKPSVVYDDMHEFFCYMDDSLIPTVIIFCAHMYSMGCYTPGTKMTKGIKRTNSITKEKELLSKYDPEKARGFKAGFEKEDV